MKWRKLGKIFDPSDCRLANADFEFAQSPQALVFENFVRIYFSTRLRTENGKYISHIQFIEIDKNFKQITDVSQHKVIELGKPGCFDEHGIFPMNVIRSGNKVYGYTCGWTRRVSVSVDSGIGLAISKDDGVTFDRIGDGPVLTASLYEPYMVADPFVKIIDGVFHMWYIYGTEWKIFDKGTVPDRVYKIGHATSKDGVIWNKEGRRLINDKYEDESQALPTVIKHNGRYHMYFCYRQSSDFRENKDRAYRIGYAYSDDLVNWVRDDDSAGISISEEGWDSDMQCYPHVFNCDGKVYMLYNGNEFGRHGFGLAVLED